MSLGSDIIYSIAGLLSSPFWGYRLWRTGKWRTDWPARLGRCDSRADGRPTLLIHAVSVGEVNAAKPLIDRIARKHGDQWRIVISVTTDTGTLEARKHFASMHEVVRYPLDFTASVRRFLEAVKPDVVVLMELEVWPTFVAECARRGAAVMVANGRLSARSYGRYRWIRPVIERSFESLALAAVQDEDYAGRFVGMGVRADRVKVLGSVKWDANSVAGPDQTLVNGAEKLASAMGIDRSAPLIVCGSTAEGEEKLFVDQLAALTPRGKPVQLMMAPRQPERFDEAAAVMGKPVRRSQSPDGMRRAAGEAGRMFLLDTIGELRKAYVLADVAVVGRSFAPLFGSNMLEPILLGKPTVIGPNVANFKDMMEKLLAGGGIVQVKDGAELRQAVERLLDEAAAQSLVERGLAVVKRQQGAVERHVEWIEKLMADRASLRDSR